MRKHYHIKLINHSIHLPDRFTVHPTTKKKKFTPKGIHSSPYFKLKKICCCVRNVHFFPFHAHVNVCRCLFSTYRAGHHKFDEEMSFVSGKLAYP